MYETTSESMGSRVRRLEKGDEKLLRGLRIAALEDSPREFSSTLAREKARTKADWQRWFEPGVTFAFEEEGEARGLVGGYVAPDIERSLYLVSMWVHPRWRGRGIAGQLIGTLLDWARQESFEACYLEVVRGSDPARQLYERHGFRATGKERPRDGVVEVEMRIDLSPRVQGS